MLANIILIIILIILLAGMILLQVYLSKRDSKWPGLVLPVISFIFSLLCVLSMAAPSEGVDAGFIVELFLTWLLSNIPTFVLLAIYFALREKKEMTKRLEKMSIQDLE